jgi:uncharacterized protein YhbP (UPF0306 family)
MNVEQAIREYIEPLVHLSLATAKGDTPWVCEIHFAYDDDLNLYFRSLRSRRHSQEIAANPKVAGNIVKQHAPGEPPTGVYFEGNAELLEPGGEQHQAYACISQRLGLGEKIWEEAKRADGHQFYKISVDNYYVFGNLGDGFKKHELKWNGGKR